MAIHAELVLQLLRHHSARHTGVRVVHRFGQRSALLREPLPFEVLRDQRHEQLHGLQPWEKEVFSARGVQEGGKALRILHINGIEVCKKRPSGVQANPTNPISLPPSLQTERLRGEDYRELCLQLPQARAARTDFRYAEERIFQLSQVADVK
jgi:hypothetical protein